MTTRTTRRAFVGWLAAAAAQSFGRHAGAATGAGAQAAGDAGAVARLRSLIAASDAAELRLDPVPRTEAARGPGDPVFVDPLSEQWYAAAQANAERDLADLGAIDRSALPPVEAIAYDVFAFRAHRELDRFRSGYWSIRRRTPLNASFGLHLELPDYVSGAGAQFVTSADYDAGIERLNGFAGYLGSVIARCRDGVATGYVQPRRIVEQVIGQCDAMLALAPDQTPFFAAVTRMPPSFDSPTRARLEHGYRATIAKNVLPGYARLRDYLKSDYLSRATDAPGLWAMRDGAQVYANELAWHTTTTRSPDELHALGLAEVARIREGMESARRAVGFAGDLTAFFEYVRQDPKFYFTKPEDLLAKFREIEARIWRGIPALFARSPKAPFEVRPLPAIGGQRGTGYYRPGPPDGVSPGVLYFNMAMLPTRPIPTLETLTLHEGIPGHHFQGMLVREDASLPEILRFGNVTAYIEGWGLYAESLGPELGMFVDPYQLFGHHDMNMLRAVRLVVDTGMHAMRWTRQQAIDYMLANTSMAPRDVAVEIDRYISYPGQACAYKSGEKKIRELRVRAEQRLGAAFDVREFHGIILDTGAMPLTVLEQKVDRWLASKRA